MNKLFFTGFMILFTVLTGCSSEPPTVGEATELGQVCDIGNDGRRVSVEGFLTLPEEISSDEDFSVLLQIRPSEDVQNLNGRVGVWTRYGSEPNQVAHVDVEYTIPSLVGVRGDEPRIPNAEQLPITRAYTDTDLQVTTSDGQQVTYTDRVRVSGTVKFPSSSAVQAISPCVLNNPLIERIQ